MKINPLDDNLRILKTLKGHKESIELLTQLTQLMIDNLSGRFDGATLTKEWRVKNIRLALYYNGE